MSEKYPDANLAALADLLVEAFATGGRGRPVLPTGFREDYLAAVAHLMISPIDREMYLAHLKRAITTYGVKDAILDFGADAEFPIEPMLSDGLQVLSDDDLASLGILGIHLEDISDLLAEEMAAGCAGQCWWALPRPPKRRHRRIEEKPRIPELPG